MDLNAWQQHSARLKAEYNHPDGKPCPVCNGSGHVMEVWSNDEHFHGLLTICPECGSVRVQKDDARKAGNAPRYGDYMTTKHGSARSTARPESCPAPAGCFYIGGQTATGKSHLCSKIYYHLMANGCSGLNFQPWKAFARRQLQGLAAHRDGQRLQYSVAGWLFGRREQQGNAQRDRPWTGP